MLRPSKGKENSHFTVGMKGLYAFGCIDARHVPITHTHTHTFVNCIYAHIYMYGQIRAFTCL